MHETLALGQVVWEEREMKELEPGQRQEPHASKSIPEAGVRELSRSRKAGCNEENARRAFPVFIAFGNQTISAQI